MAAARSVGLPTFKASCFWVHRFKKRYNILSRKIIKFVSRVSDVDSAERAKQANKFEKEIRSIKDLKL